MRRAIVLVSLLLACSGRTSTTPEVDVNLSTLAKKHRHRTTTDERVVLVTIDGARWQDVFGGSDPAWSGAPHVPAEELMPRTYQLLATRGVALGADGAGCGTVHTASGSNVSLPGYQEIFSGKPSFCLDNDCSPLSASVMDEAAAAGVSGVASVGSWGKLERAVSGGRADVHVDVGAESPEDDTFPGGEDYRPDVKTTAKALAYFLENKPAFFHVGLGDTDEYGHRNDYVAYLGALRAADTFLGDLVDAIDSTPEIADKTTILVTPDHGRNSDFRDHGALRPESGRTFLLAFGPRVTARGIGCPARDVTLVDIAPTIQKLLGLTVTGPGTPIDEIP